MAKEPKFNPMDILTHEDIVDLKAAPREIPRPKGKKPLHYSTIWRWHKRGINGVKLETVKLGQQYFTSKQAIHRFLQRTQG